MKLFVHLLAIIFSSIFFIIFTHQSAQAQTTRETEKQEIKRNSSSRTSKNKLKLKTSAETQKDFQKRMKNVVKDHRKRAKEMEKPQYSDPSYFGHKRKPKIRKKGKRKMCKECGIVH
jgi:Flp pilus assembly protein TadB